MPEHTELAWIFNCVTPIGELERMTQFKEKAKQHRENINMGLLDYPVLQTADILIYKAGYVPVGEDQIQHVELSPEIARRFNARFGEVFPEPKVLLSEAPRIMGTDGKSKMSKSMNNYIGLLEPAEAIWEKLRTAATCEHRQRRTDPGHPEHCNIFSMHEAFSKPDQIAFIDDGCRTAGIGCIECKKPLIDSVVAEIKGFRARAQEFEESRDLVRGIVNEGSERARDAARRTMADVREAIGLEYG